MKKTAITVIGDLTRVAGKPWSIKAKWDIPVERAGWDCHITIDAEEYEGRLWISIWAKGRPTRDCDPKLDDAFYIALSGRALPSRITRKWIESVFRHEVETARTAALGFTESDLHYPNKEFVMDDPEEMEERHGRWAYFESSLEVSK
jgi:hypothetical protein